MLAAGTVRESSSGRSSEVPSPGSVSKPSKDTSLFTIMGHCRFQIKWLTAESNPRWGWKMRVDL